MELPEQQLNAESTNINTKWLDNIYENIKNIEVYERLSREGCSSVMDYLQIPYEYRDKILADTQYKNLRLLANEFILVLPDITPVIGEDQAKEISDALKIYIMYLNQKELFIESSYSESNNKIVNSRPTEYFYEVLDGLSLVRKQLILSIQHIVYIKPSEKPKW